MGIITEQFRAWLSDFQRPIGEVAHEAYLRSRERTCKQQTKELTDAIWKVLGYYVPGRSVDQARLYNGHPTVLIEGLRFVFRNGNLGLIQECPDCGHTGDILVASLADLGRILQPDVIYCTECDKRASFRKFPAGGRY